MRTSLLLAGLISATFLGAQHERLTGYTWDPSPKPPDAKVIGDRTQVLLERHIRGQFVEHDDKVFYYELFHMRLYLGDQNAVEGNSTVEVPTGHIAEVKRIQARSVAPDGTVHELAEDAFKRSTDERDGSGQLYFAFEGLRPGSVVEYILLAQQRGDLQGEVTRLQFGFPVVNTSYELLVPKDWKYLFKGYNGVPQPAVDSTLEDVLRHHVELADLPAIEDERSANPGSHRMYLVGKLDGVPDRNVHDYSSYVSASRYYNRRLYPPLEKSTQKALAALLKKMDLGYARDEEDRIRTMDTYIRTNFRLAESGSGGLDDLDQVLRTGNCDNTGLQRLYANLLREAGIEHQVVVTCDRTGTPFDKDFPAYNYLRDLSFFFPSINKYLDPTQLELGLGYLPAENMGTYGLYVRNLVVNDVPTGIGTVKFIPELPAEATRHDLDVKVTFSPEATESTIDLTNELTGYYASFIQNFWNYLDDEQRGKMIQEQFNHLLEGSTAHTINAENGEHKYFGVKPFVFKGTVTTPRLNGVAGEDILFKVGELIGPQMEMYAEKDRKLPVDEDFNRYYDRRITVTLPAGWTVQDISGLNINKKVELDGKVVAEFRSTATQEGDVITVEALEYYRSTHFPLERFEDYRAVINAAADFNKQALLLHRTR